MFECEYCGTQLIQHQTNCPNCGALMKMESVTGAPHKSAAGLAARITQICQRYEDIDVVYLYETLTDGERRVVRKYFKVPDQEQIIMLYDDTLLGRRKKGFVVGTTGLYWRNHWTTDTKRNQLSWTDLAERTIKLDDLRIALGRGDHIGIAASGGREIQSRLVRLLNEIKEAVKS